MEKNILRVEFKGQTLTDTRPLFQYDYGQKIKFVDLTLPSSYEVHFSNYDNNESITMIGDSTGVLIPDELLQTGLNIYVWVYLHDYTDDGETEYSCIIPVYRRAKPSNQEPTPVQQDTITQTLARMNAAASTCTEESSLAIEAAREADICRSGCYTFMQLTEGYKNQTVQYATHVPLPPTEDGTYKLTVVIENGEPTYIWAEED